MPFQKIFDSVETLKSFDYNDMIYLIKYREHTKTVLDIIYTASDKPENRMDLAHKVSW